MTNQIEQAAREAFCNGVSWTDFLAMHRDRVIVLSVPARERLLSLVVSGDFPTKAFDDLEPLPAMRPPHDTHTAAHFLFPFPTLLRLQAEAFVNQ